jgi:hypothetical protein
MFPKTGIVGTGWSPTTVRGQWWWIQANFFPPSGFIAGAMGLPMMAPA